MKVPGYITVELCGLSMWWILYRMFPIHLRLSWTVFGTLVNKINPQNKFLNK